MEASPPSCDVNWIERKDARVDIEDAAELSRNQCDVKPEFTAGSKNVTLFFFFKKVCNLGILIGNCKKLNLLRKEMLRNKY